MYCGPKCLKEIYPDKTIEELASICDTELNGSTIYDMADAINFLGDASMLYFNASLDQMEVELEKDRKVIVLFQSHYCIVTSINEKTIELHDPSFGKHVTKDKKDFDKIWRNRNSEAIRVYISIIK